MELDETMVEEVDNTVEDDTLPEGIVEEADESEEITESELEEEIAPAEEPEKPVQKATEPGWIKRRVNEAVEKALAKERAAMQAEYDAKYSPLMERMIEMDARELVRNGTVKDLETAKELVRYRQNNPQPVQPRNERGQFAPKEDAGTTARINMLKHQAAVIMERRGIDVVKEFNTNPKIKNAVIAGEMDFYDVAETLSKPKKKPPAPMRTPNGATTDEPVNAIDLMTDEQFAKLEKRIQGGARIRQK